MHWSHVLQAPNDQCPQVLGSPLSAMDVTSEPLEDSKMQSQLALGGRPRESVVPRGTDAHMLFSVNQKWKRAQVLHLCGFKARQPYIFFGPKTNGLRVRCQLVRSGCSPCLQKSVQTTVRNTSRVYAVSQSGPGAEFACRKVFRQQSATLPGFLSRL